MNRVFALAGAILCVAAACSRASSSVATTSSSAGVGDGRLDQLIAVLDTVQGEFRDVADLTFVFMSESRVLEEIAAFDEAAVPRLVQCLGDTRLARATAEHVGRVRVGVLCGEALVYTDYFQARNSTDQWPEGFTDSTFYGYDASPDELHRAQRAWQAYLQREAASK